MGLRAMVEILCGALPGEPRQDRPFLPRDRSDAVSEEGAVESDLDALADRLRGTRPIDPGRPVLVAGDPEREARERRLESGIPLSRSVIEDMRTVARGSGVPFDL